MNHRQTDSAMWSDLLKIRNIYLQGRQIEIGDGKNTLFWKDSWLYSKPLCILFPELFKICEQPELTVFHLKSDINSMTFTRWLVDDLRVDWLTILSKLDDIQLPDERDVIKWRFGTNGKFSVKSVYKAMTINDVGPYHKMIWKGKIPSKIKIFLWLSQ